MYACLCRGITEADVREAGRRGVTRPDELIVLLGLADEGCCGRCAARIEEFVELARGGAGAPTGQAWGRLAHPARAGGT